MREVLQGVLYVLETGCQWRHLPKDFPPRSTVWAYFDLRRYDGTLDPIHETLYLALSAAAGREASPTAAIADSQSVKSAEKRGARCRETGYDACKKTKGIKRYAFVDTLDRMLRVVIHPANVQDRDGADLVLNRRTRRRFPFIDVVFADQGYQGAKAAQNMAGTGRWRLEIVRRGPARKASPCPPSGGSSRECCRGSGAIGASPAPPRPSSSWP